MDFNESPVYKYGVSVPTVKPVKIAVYNGKPLPSFMVIQGYDSGDWKEMLRVNKISPFELESGQEVTLPVQTRISRFSTHSES